MPPSPPHRRRWEDIDRLKLGKPEHDVVSLHRAMDKRARIEQADATHRARTAELQREVGSARRTVKVTLLALDDASSDDDDKGHDGEAGNRSASDSAKASRLQRLLQNAAMSTNQLAELASHHNCEVTEYSSFQSAPKNQLTVEDRRVLLGHDALKRQYEAREEENRHAVKVRHHLDRAVEFSMSVSMSLKHRPNTPSPAAPYVPVQHPRAWISRANSKPPVIPPSPEVVRLRKRVATPLVSGIAAFGDGSAVHHPLEDRSVVGFMNAFPRPKSVPPHLRHSASRPASPTMHSTDSSMLSSSPTASWTRDMFLACNRRVIQALAQLLPTEAWRLATECEQRLAVADDSIFASPAERHVVTAASLHNLGLVCAHAHRDAEALDAFNRSLREEELAGCPLSAVTLTNMAAVLMNVGRVQDALDVATIAASLVDGNPDVDPATALLVQRQLTVCEDAMRARVSSRQSNTHSANGAVSTTAIVPYSRRKHLPKAMKHYQKFSNPLGFPLAADASTALPDISSIHHDGDDALDGTSWVADDSSRTRTPNLVDRSVSQLGRDHHITKLLRATTPMASLHR